MKLLKNVALILALLQVAFLTLPLHAQLPDSLTPHLRWVHPSFSEVGAISQDGSKVLFITYTQFGIWKRGEREITRMYDFGMGGRIAQAFAPGDSAIYVLMGDNFQWLVSPNGDRYMDFMKSKSIAIRLYKYFLTDGHRVLIGTFTTEAANLIFSEDGSKIFAFSNVFLKVIDTKTGNVVDSCGSVPVGKHQGFPISMTGEAPLNAVLSSPNGDLYVVADGLHELSVFSQVPLKLLYTLPQAGGRLGVQSAWISGSNRLTIVTHDSVRFWNLESRSFEDAMAKPREENLTWISDDSFVGIRRFRAKGYYHPELAFENVRSLPSDPTPDDSLFVTNQALASSRYIGPIVGLYQLLFRTQRYLVFGEQRAATVLLDLQTLKCEPLPGIGKNVRGLMSINNGNELLQYARNGAGVTLNSKNGVTVKRNLPYTSQATISADGKLEFEWTWSEGFVVRERKTGRITFRLPNNAAPRGPTFSPDGKWLTYSVSGDFGFHAFRIVSTDSSDSPRDLGTFESNNYRFANDSRSIFFYKGSSICRWDIVSKRMVDSANFGDDGMFNALISQDEQWFVAPSYDRKIRIFNLKKMELMSILDFSSSPYSFAFTPNQRYLLVSFEHGVRLVDLLLDSVLDTIPGFETRIWLQDCLLTSGGFYTLDDDGMLRGYDVPYAWIRPTKDPIGAHKHFVPIAIWIPNPSDSSRQSSTKQRYAKVFVRVDILDGNHAVIATPQNAPMSSEGWLRLDWDATGRPNGRYYMRTSIGGVVDEKPLELK
jgi:hypothetical protein